MFNIIEKSFSEHSGTAILKGVKKLKKGEVDFLNQAEHQLKICNKILDASVIAADILSKPSYKLKPLFEAFSTVKPVVSLCKIFVDKHQSMSDHIEELNVCFGLDDSLWGSIKHTAFLTGVMLTNGELLKDCVMRLTHESENIARVDDITKASSDIKKYCNENAEDLQAATNILMQAEQYYESSAT